MKIQIESIGLNFEGTVDEAEAIGVKKTSCIMDRAPHETDGNYHDAYTGDIPLGAI